MAQQKYIGRDCELSTTGMGKFGQSLSCWSVTRSVLQQIDIAAATAGATVWAGDPQEESSSAAASPSASSIDCLRHWTSAGQCFYADMAHVEVCTPTTLYPRSFAAHSIATLLTAEQARRFAELAEEPGTQYELSASNADLSDQSISFGSHVSVSVSAALWENLFVDPRFPAVLGFVASAVAAAIPFFGAGYILPAEGRFIYSLSARAHHISKLQTLVTTEKWRRGLLNSRREPHGTSQERLHLIGFDYSLTASSLLASFLQCALAAGEEGYCGMNLLDPVGAMRQWSWELDLTTGKMPATATLVDGRQLTLPEYMRELTTALLHMCEVGLIEEDVAPESKQLLPRIIELAHHAEEGSLQRCAQHLDWAAKLLYLLNLQSGLGSAESRLADHDFANTNPDKGMFWRLWEQGLIDPLVDMSDARSCMREAPTESRDWGRGRLIEQFAPHVFAVDWSRVDLHVSSSPFSERLRVDLPDLYSLNQSQFERIVGSIRDVEQLRDMLHHHHLCREDKSR